MPVRKLDPEEEIVTVRKLGADEEIIPERTAATHARGFGKGLVSGLTDVGPVVGGMSIGGLAAGPPGAVVGGIAGFAGSQAAREIFDVKRPEALPPGERPAAFAGEVIGGAIPIGAGTIGAARHGFRFAQGRVGTFLNRILESAVAKAKYFLPGLTANFGM